MGASAADIGLLLWIAVIIMGLSLLMRWRRQRAASAMPSRSICLWRIDEHVELVHIRVRAPEQPGEARPKHSYEIPPFLRADQEADGTGRGDEEKSPSP